MISQHPAPLPGTFDIDGAASDPLRIKMYCPNHLFLSWQGHIVFGIAQCLFDHGVDLEVWVRSVEAADRRCYVREGAPGYLHKVLYKLRQVQVVHRLTERRFLASLRKGDIVYTWPTASNHLLRQIKDRGHTILMEAINCSEATCRRILADAYLRLGVPQDPPVGQGAVEGERSKLRLADRIVTAHRLSTQSYIEAGVPEDQILESFYGWDPDRFSGTGRALPPTEGLSVLFVGSPIVRKGVHLLLEAWDRAKILGRLVLVGGTPEPIIRDRCSRYFTRPDIQWLSWSKDIGDYFRSSDIFAFPSLEEGGPLVIYEAMGCGLPSVASPMGGGAIGWEREGCIILDPYDVDAWAETFRRLADDQEYRRELGEQARRAARRFTWNEAGLKRLSQFRTLERSDGHRATVSHE